MSKATELALLKRSRSINASIGVSKRSGERENVGEMLDVYVHVESAEDEYLRNEENARKEVFLKGFPLQEEYVCHRYGHLQLREQAHPP